MKIVKCISYDRTNCKKLSSLDEAKDRCVEDEDCKAVYFDSSKRHYMLSGLKLKRSRDPKDKIFTVEKCKTTCDAGKQRCEDGECREKCSEEDDDCPAGTTLCPDGVRKHIHMC